MSERLFTIFEKVTRGYTKENVKYHSAKSGWHNSFFHSQLPKPCWICRFSFMETIARMISSKEGLGSFGKGFFKNGFTSEAKTGIVKKKTSLGF